MIYIPHEWLHDVVVTDDSISVTWNFVHEAGAKEFCQYLGDRPEGDSEFDILQFFFSRKCINKAPSEKILKYLPHLS